MYASSTFPYCLVRAFGLHPSKSSSCRHTSYEIYQYFTYGFDSALFEATPSITSVAPVVHYLEVFLLSDRHMWHDSQGHLCQTTRTETALLSGFHGHLPVMYIDAVSCARSTVISSECAKDDQRRLSEVAQSGGCRGKPYTCSQSLYHEAQPIMPRSGRWDIC